jgi:cell division protein FtsB
MTSETRSLSPTVYQIFIVALVLMVGILWWGYNNNNQTVETQKVTIADFKAKLNATTLENTGLRGQITTLTNDKGTLQNQVKILTNQTALIQSQVAKLSANVTTLNGQIVELNTLVTSKTAKISNLTTTNTNLKNQITTINAQVATLQSKISNQTAIINMGKSLVFANDKNVTVLANQLSYLEYKTNFAGYLGITFTSTSKVYLEIGSSEATSTWYGRYPNTGTIEAASFKIPVMPGTTYIKIVNLSLTNNAVIFYYITYYY